jgi:hypothetical protein
MTMNTNGQHTNSPARLSEGERADMRRDFARFMADNPTPSLPTRPVRSPYAALVRYQAFAYVMLLFVILGGTAYAAEGSLPQDLLYPVKIQVVEPLVSGTAALLGASQGDVQSALVERRLKEAEQLVSQGELDGDVADFLSEKIDDSSDKVEAYASKASRDGRIDDALDASSKLETVLVAHGQVLESVADDRATTTPDIEQFVYDIQAKGDEAQAFSEKTEDALGAATTSQAMQYVGELEETASTTIAEFAQALAAAGNPDDAAQLLAQARAAYAAGADSLGRSDYDAALSSLRDAQGAAEQGNILLDSLEDFPAADDSSETASTTEE